MDIVFIRLLVRASSLVIGVRSGIKISFVLRLGICGVIGLVTCFGMVRVSGVMGWAICLGRMRASGETANPVSQERLGVAIFGVTVGM